MSNLHEEMFIEEANELLEELEISLLQLEKNKEDSNLIGKVFRALHTIKGSGAMFGFDEISEFTHEVENIFDLVRDKKIKVTRELIDLGLSSQDMIKKMLYNKNKDEEIEKCKNEIIEAAKKFYFTYKKIEEQSEKTIPEEEGMNLTYRIRFKPSFELQNKGTNLTPLLKEISELGICRVVVHDNDIPPLERLKPDAGNVRWDIILTTSKGLNAIKDVFIFVEDDSQITIDVIDGGAITEEDTNYKKLGDILVERGDLSLQDMQAILASKKRFGEILVDEGLVAPEKIKSALVEQEHIRELKKKQREEETVTTLRVTADKADKLINLVGELVTMQARLAQVATQIDNPELLSVSEEAERLIWDLRDSAMSIRMLPIGAGFSRFVHLTRDLSTNLGKDVELITGGGDTELDKTIIERLNDPLVHVIRNCIDHGIEAPGKRKQSGKPAKGTIHLNASYSGANVVIDIHDDGAGIDRNAVKAKAIEKGFIKPGVDLTDNEIYSLLFEPGFSTVEEITNVSGRGVGMDVIKKNVEALRGTVQVESRENEETRVTFRIPLTLAIIEGLMVEISSEKFIIPLAIVEEIVELTSEDRNKTHGRNIIDIRGKIVPYILLRDTFNIDGAPLEIEQIVVVEVENRRVGFVVDRVIGKHQTVIKSLGKMYRNVEGLSGATILGDGTVALILDVSKLAHLEEIKEEKRSQSGNEHVE